MRQRTMEVQNEWRSKFRGEVYGTGTGVWVGYRVAAGLLMPPICCAVVTRESAALAVIRRWHLARVEVYLTTEKGIKRLWPKKSEALREI